jgi:hypothetical protein
MLKSVNVDMGTDVNLVLWDLPSLLIGPVVIHPKICQLSNSIRIHSQYIENPKGIIWH